MSRIRRQLDHWSTKVATAAIELIALLHPSAYSELVVNDLIWCLDEPLLRCEALRALRKVGSVLLSPHIQRFISIVEDPAYPCTLGIRHQAVHTIEVCSGDAITPHVALLVPCAYYQNWAKYIIVVPRQVLVESFAKCFYKVDHTLLVPHAEAIASYNNSLALRAIIERDELKMGAKDYD